MQPLALAVANTAALWFRPRLLGPAHAIRIEWDIHFEPPAVIRISTCSCYVMIGGHLIRLAHWLYPSVHAVETADSKRDDMIHIDLQVSHPWLGVVFGYEGTFRVRTFQK